jgi:hypothetical protein
MKTEIKNARKYLNVFSNLKPLSLRAVFSLGKIKIQSKNWDCLDKSG